MTISANRLVGAATMFTGICVCLWLALGVPQEWTGGMRWLRTALALASLGAISLGVRLVFPDRDTDTPREAPGGEGADTRV
ncbi:hypothetical protein [Streptomyces caniscabiei]|uniref:hypothetical protein n=1 Tax=Streptomyces caniscabiei TaxID=2746961 RepID=UPI000765D0DB|nr:hypothetical protein [Streptomyces caniscabiei]